MQKKISEKLLHDYLEYGRTSREIYEWAHREVDKNLNIELVTALVEKCETERDIAYVAAGPLEDLFQREADVIKDKLDNALRKSIKLRKALEGVWISKPSKARDILTFLLNKYNLTQERL